MSDNSKLTIHSEQTSQSWANQLRGPIKTPTKQDKPFSPTVPREPKFHTTQRANMNQWPGPADLDKASSAGGSPRPSHERKLSGPFGRVPANRASPLNERKGRPGFGSESPVSSPVRKGGAKDDRFDWATSLRPTTQRQGEGLRRDWSAHSKPLRSTVARQPLTSQNSGMSDMQTVPESPTVQPYGEDASSMAYDPESPHVLSHNRGRSGIPAPPPPADLPAAGAPSVRHVQQRSRGQFSPTNRGPAPAPFATMPRYEDDVSTRAESVVAESVIEHDGEEVARQQALDQQLLRDAVPLDDEEENLAAQHARDGSLGGNSQGSRGDHKRLFNPITHEALPYSPNTKFGRGRGHLPSPSAAAAQSAPFATEYNTPSGEEGSTAEMDSHPDVPDIDFRTMEAHPTKIKREAAAVGGEEEEEDESAIGGSATVATVFAKKEKHPRSGSNIPSSPRTTGHRRISSRGKAGFMSPTQSALAHARTPSKIASPSVVLERTGSGSGSPGRNSPGGRRTPTNLTPRGASALGAGAAAPAATVVVTRSRAAGPTFSDEPASVAAAAPVAPVVVPSDLVAEPELHAVKVEEETVAAAAGAAVAAATGAAVDEVPVTEPANRDFSLPSAAAFQEQEEAKIVATASPTTTLDMSAPEPFDSAAVAEEEAELTPAAFLAEQEAIIAAEQAEEEVTVVAAAPEAALPEEFPTVAAPSDAFVDEVREFDADAKVDGPELQVSAPEPDSLDYVAAPSYEQQGDDFAPAPAADMAFGTADELVAQAPAVEELTSGGDVTLEDDDDITARSAVLSGGGAAATLTGAASLTTEAEELEVMMPPAPASEEYDVEGGVLMMAADKDQQQQEEERDGASAAAAGLAAGVAGLAVAGGAATVAKEEELEGEFTDAQEALLVSSVKDDIDFTVPDANDFTIPDDNADLTPVDAGLTVSAPAVEVEPLEHDALDSKEVQQQEVEEVGASRELSLPAEGPSADATATADLGLDGVAPGAIKTRQQSEMPMEALKHTPAGQKLITEAQVVAQMTVKEAVDQLAAGTVVYKAWVRDGKQKGSTRHVKAKVLNDLVLLTYQSGLAKKTQTVVVIRCCLTIEANKTTLLLETDNGTLAVRPSTPQHETLWALGINAMLHLAEKQDRLNQTEALMDLPWHGIVQGNQ